MLLLPLVSWIGAGWIGVWWTIVTFRFMRRMERMVGLGLLIATALAVPGYRLAAGLYGLATDPKVKTTTEAAAGAYVAIQDADDWSLPARLDRQIGVLDADEGTAVVGCRMTEAGC